MALPNFRDGEFLGDHIRSIMDFYHPRCVDPNGGFFQHFRDDGSIYDPNTRHLVSSARFVFNYAMAAKFFDNREYLQTCQHGIDYLRNTHLQKTTQGYAWLLDEGGVRDSTNHCYGLAFVMLAYAKSLEAGLLPAADYLEETFQLMGQHFWSAEDRLYNDEASADWSVVAPYRGQNANMHACEAILAAYEATKDHKYLERAYLLAERMIRDLAQQGNGLIWEHYDTNWKIDWNYNRDNPKHLFRPWGFQPGHQTEWAKLLLLLNQYRPSDWLITRAQELFDRALEIAWDTDHGGLCYGFDPNGQICDTDKYFWVQAESIAAAALLALHTENKKYWYWYDRFWRYAWEHMIDHKHGAWYRILKQNNEKYDDLKSPAGKTDYHTMGACYEIIRALENGNNT